MKVVRIFLVALTLFAVISAAVLGAGWVWRDPLLNQVVRPRLEQLLAKRLDGQVRIGHLTLETQQASIKDLVVTRADSFSLEIPAIQARFSLPALAQRVLTAVEIDRPRVVVRSSQSDESGTIALPHAGGFDIERLRIRHGDFYLENGVVSARLQDLQFSAQSRSPGESLDVELRAQVGELRPVSLVTQGTLQIKPRAELTLNTLFWDQHALLTRPVRVSFGERYSASEIHLTLTRFSDEELYRWTRVFGYSPDFSSQLNFNLRNLDIELVLAQDALRALLTAPQGRLGYGARVLNFTNAAAQLGGDASRWQAQIHLTPDGQQVVSGHLRGRETALSGELKTQGVDGLWLQRLILGREALATRGALALRAGISGEFSAPVVELNFQGESLPESGPALLNLAPLSGGLEFQAMPPFEFKGRMAMAQRPVLTFEGSTERLAFQLLSVDDSMFATLFGRERLPADLSLTRAQAAGIFHPHDDGMRGDVDFEFAELDWQQLTISDLSLSGTVFVDHDHRRFSWRNLKSSLSAGGAHGSLHSQGEAVLNDDGVRLVAESVQLSDFEYFSAAGLSGFNRGGLELGGEALWHWDEGWRWNLAGTLGLGEVLHGGFFADLSGHEGRFSLAGTALPIEKSWHLEKLNLDFDDLVSIEGSALWQKAELDVRASLKVPDLQKGWTTLQQIAELPQSVAADGLDLTGRLGAYGSLQGTPDSLRLQGVLQPERLRLHWPARALEIRGLRGRIPFDLHLKEPLTDPAIWPERSGSLEIPYMVWGPARFAPGQTLHLSAGANRLEMHSPLVFFLSGGILTLSGFEFGWGAGGLQSTGRLMAADVDLDLLASRYNLPRISGSLSADLQRLSYRDGLLETEGQVVADAFGGRMGLDRIRARHIGTRFPVFGGNLEFRGIDLGELTRTAALGEITGTMDGRVQGLRLFETMPTQFRASFATRPQGERTINVKAIRNLTLISQGGLSGALSSGIHRFIDSYNYRAIGLSCTLDNDVFTLRGTAVPERNILVDGGVLPPRIEIIAPQNQISFREMLKRLGRMERVQ